MSKEVFFLGAGFSKYLDEKYPLLTNLTNLIRLFTRKENNFDKFDDIEQYLTYLVSKLPFKDEATIYENLAEYKRLTKIIADYFWELGNKEIPNLSDKQNEIFKIILDRKIPCITMNYDLLLEKILLNIKQKNSKLEYRMVDFYEILSRYIYKANISSLDAYELECMFDDNLPKEERIKMPEILKLHGSINWYYNGIATNDTIYLYENSNDEDLKDNLSNFIIPPTLDKQSLYSHIAITNLWKQAYKYLANAEKIYVFGYSFPKSDISVDTLFRSALANNSNDYKIYIFGNSENENQRYKEIFKDKKEVNSEAFKNKKRNHGFIDIIYKNKKIYEYSHGNDKNTERLLEILNSN